MVLFHNFIQSEIPKNKNYMRIVIVIADIRKTGGTERATITVANSLCEKHEVIILSLGPAGKPFFLVDNTVNLVFMGLKEIPSKIYNKLFWYLQLWQNLKANLKVFSPDLIIGQGHNISSIIPFIKNRESKTVACEHIDYSSIPEWSRRLMKISYQKLDCMVVLSEIAKNKMLDLNHRIFVIPNSIPFDTEKISEQKNEKIIMVGRISKEKGYERIVPVAKKLQQEFPRWIINIYGNGSSKIELQKLLRCDNVRNVIIHDPVADIKERYLDSSIHLITSYNEAMPMVILEAQYCGLPVIGYRCEGTESLVQNGLNGFIVDSNEEFYEKLKFLITDIKERRKIGIEGRKTSSFYDTKYTKTQWEKIIKNLG